MTGSGLAAKFGIKSTAGRSKIEQLVLRVYSLMVRCKQILFKSTQQNQGRLTQGGEIRGREAAWEPGEGVAGKLENTGSGKAEVTMPPAYGICGAASYGSRRRPHQERERWSWCERGSGGRSDK